MIFEMTTLVNGFKLEPESKTNMFLMTCLLNLQRAQPHTKRVFTFRAPLFVNSCLISIIISPHCTYGIILYYLT